MARYRVYGTASVALMAEFTDDGSDLHDQAELALRGEFRPTFSHVAMQFEVENMEEIDTPPTLGEIIKTKVSRARAWVMGE